MKLFVLFSIAVLKSGNISKRKTFNNVRRSGDFVSTDTEWETFHKVDGIDSTDYFLCTKWFISTHITHKHCFTTMPLLRVVFNIFGLRSPLNNQFLCPHSLCLSYPISQKSIVFISNVTGGEKKVEGKRL